MPEIIAYLTTKRRIDFSVIPPDQFVAELGAVIEPFCNFIRDASDDRVKERFSRKFGEGGVKEYLYNICKLILTKYTDFGSDEFRRHIDQKSSEQVEEARRFIMTLSKNMIDCVVKILKGHYGERRMPSGEAAYWELGVTSSRVRKSAYEQQQAAPVDRRQPKEAYLHIMDLKDIVEQDDNWPHFEGIFSVPLPGEKRGKKHYTGWIAKFNEVRNIAAHENALRTYSDEDLEFIDWLRADVAPGIETELQRA